MGHRSWTGVGQDFIIQRVQRVIDGRILCIDVSWFGSKFRVINVYCPVELQDKEVILGGDFNCLVNKKDKQTTSTVRLDSSSEILQNIIKDFRLRDAYRSKNPILPGYTWSNGRTHSRIDFLLTSMGDIMYKPLVKG
uniref:Endonuclease/exonuclease/phosphatase domain-containing protein n=1 Tax=Sparus aurata TaxID=8175 RepID=A0A671WNH1_SPAAU